MRGNVDSGWNCDCCTGFSETRASHKLMWEKEVKEQIVDAAEEETDN